MAVMRAFRLEKLVRDGIVEQNEGFGAVVDYEVLSGEELKRALEQKLAEEKAEFEEADTDEAKAKEQRDIDDILFALGRSKAEDYEPHNTFNDGRFVHTVALPQDSEAGVYWTNYYLADPARFPEVTV
jgi:predicted house-cleaning noncanonical NTP pyrophosphatase (MazG superfamily)